LRSVWQRTENLETAAPRWAPPFQRDQSMIDSVTWSRMNRRDDPSTGTASRYTCVLVPSPFEKLSTRTPPELHSPSSAATWTSYTTLSTASGLVNVSVRYSPSTSSTVNVPVPTDGKPSRAGTDGSRPSANFRKFGIPSPDGL